MFPSENLKMRMSYHLVMQKSQTSHQMFCCLTGMFWNGWHVNEQFLAATKQLYDWFSLSVCPSVRLSVCLSVRPSHLFHHVPIIVSSWNFEELLPWSEMMSMQKVKVRGQRSRSQRSTSKLVVSGPLLQFEFTYGNEIMHTAGSSIEEVPYSFSMSSIKFQGHTALKIAEFDPDWAFPDCNSNLNSPMATKWCTKLEVA